MVAKALLCSRFKARLFAAIYCPPDSLAVTAFIVNSLLFSPSGRTKTKLSLGEIELLYTVYSDWLIYTDFYSIKKS